MTLERCLKPYNKHQDQVRNYLLQELVTMALLLSFLLLLPLDDFRCYRRYRYLGALEAILQRLLVRC